MILFRWVKFVLGLNHSPPVIHARKLSDVRKEHQIRPLIELTKIGFLSASLSNSEIRCLESRHGGLNIAWSK